MNVTISTQRIHASCALSIALLISGTTVASHRVDLPPGEAYRNGYEEMTSLRDDCTGRAGARIITFDHGTRQATPACSSSSQSAPPSTPPVRLAQPLSGRQSLRSGEPIRYSF
ncbi:hypothetical protein [Stutzerimonas marianensis]